MIWLSGKVYIVTSRIAPRFAQVICEPKLCFQRTECFVMSRDKTQIPILKGRQARGRCRKTGNSLPARRYNSRCLLRTTSTMTDFSLIFGYPFNPCS
jgi:hypothetical protein